MSTFRPAHVNDYVEWLRPYLEQGGKPTHYYDYPFSRQRWLIAEKDFTTGGECGSLAAHIIVPAGIEYGGGGLGHNELYFMDGHRQSGNFVPIFDEPVFPSLSEDLPAFITEQKAKHAAFRDDMERRRDESLWRSRQGDLGRYLHPKR